MGNRNQQAMGLRNTGMRAATRGQTPPGCGSQRNRIGSCSTGIVRQRCIAVASVGWSMPSVWQYSLSTRPMDRRRESGGKTGIGLAVERESCACGGDLADAPATIARAPCWNRNTAIPRRSQPHPTRGASLPAGVSDAIRWAISPAIRIVRQAGCGELALLRRSGL
jgi:hypothetical protein